jgi:hypothetical protein
MCQAPFADDSSKCHRRGSVREPPPTFGVHVAVPLQSARARLPISDTEQRPSENRCDDKLSKARDSERASTAGHTAFAADALSVL